MSAYIEITSLVPCRNRTQPKKIPPTQLHTKHAYVDVSIVAWNWEGSWMLQFPILNMKLLKQLYRIMSYVLFIGALLELFRAEVNNEILKALSSTICSYHSIIVLFCNSTGKIMTRRLIPWIELIYMIKFRPRSAIRLLFTFALIE